MKIYYINQKLSFRDKYYIYNEDNEAYLKVVSSRISAFFDRLFGDIISFGHTIYIQYLNGNEFCTIKRRKGFFAEKYDIYIKGEHIAFFSEKIMTFKPSITIKSEGVDYFIKGDPFVSNISIYREQMEIAKVWKSMFKLTDKYKIEIYDTIQEIICLSSVIIIDKAFHN